MPSSFLSGITSLPKVNVVRVIDEVYLGGRWISTDTYVADEVLEAQAEKLLLKESHRVGYGIHLQVDRQWDAFNDVIGQCAASDPAILPSQDWGVANDPAQFYDDATHPWLKTGWMNRVKWMLAAGLVNRRTQWVRMQSDPRV